MFANLLMATRGRPVQVWLGSAAAFLLHVVLAVTVGVALFHLLPHRVVEAIVAAMFLFGAGYAGVEARREPSEKEELSAREAGRHNALVTAFIVIVVAEWGDLTQILIANLAARYHSALSVGVGSILALWAVSGLAVVGGQALLRVVDVRTVRIVTAVALLGIGIYTLVLAVR